MENNIGCKINVEEKDSIINIDTNIVENDKNSHLKGIMIGLLGKKSIGDYLEVLVGIIKGL